MRDVAAYGRAEEDRDVEPGTLLLAAPGLLDPNFRRTVVYVIRASGEGTLACADAERRGGAGGAAGVAPHTTRPKAVFVGGPWTRKTALCLAPFAAGTTGSIGGVSPSVGRWR